MKQEYGQDKTVTLDNLTEHDEELRQMQQQLDADLLAQHITVSDDLIARTLRAVQQTSEQKEISDTKIQPRWKYYVTHGLAIAAGMILLCVSLTMLQEITGRNEKSMDAQSSQGVAIESASDQFMNSTMDCNADEMASEAINREEDAEKKITFDVAPDIVYSCGTEYESTYVFYVSDVQTVWCGQLVCIDLSRNTMKLIMTVELQEAPQRVEFYDGVLHVQMQDRWFLFEE